MYGEVDFYTIKKQVRKWLWQRRRKKLVDISIVLMIMGDCSEQKVEAKVWDDLPLKFYSIFKGSLG